MEQVKLQIAIISGTNREGAYSLKLSENIKSIIEQLGHNTILLDLKKLPNEIFQGSSYNKKPKSFTQWQEAVDNSAGIIFCVPEYNGSIPGILKYFMDMMAYPDSIKNKPVSLFGLSSGGSGAVNAIENLKHLLLFQNAQLFNTYVTIPRCMNAISESGIMSSELSSQLSKNIEEFVKFSILKLEKIV